MKKLTALMGCSLLVALIAAGCGGGSSTPSEPILFVGAASESLLPTVNGARDYLQTAPGWPAANKLNPNNPGVFVPRWDQGVVNVGNGNSDGSWVHDDIRTTAIAVERDGKQIIFITANTYMFLKGDVDEMITRIRAALPAKWKTAEVMISSSHNHAGPETAFSPNPQWFEMAIGQIVKAAVASTSAPEPATASVANGVHNYGSVDQREPDVYDTRLNVMSFKSILTGKSIATMIQWNSHPEVTLGWEPPAADAGLAAACQAKGWTGSNCTAKNRYFTGDFVGVLETRVKAARGGEVAYFNGAVGVLTGPLHASTWLVDKDHPVGDGKTVPPGAVPLATCNKANVYECQSFAKTESMGNELANAVNALLDNAKPMVVKTINVRKQEFYLRLTNLGFRSLAAQGQLGYKPMPLYNCTGKPFTDANCTSAGTQTVSDPILAGLGTSPLITKGDVLKSQVMHVSFGDVGMLFLPGEASSEVVIGLPSDFNSAPLSKYYHDAAADHAIGANYTIPGYYLSLVQEPVTFVVGLGMDELGYFVPASDYRLQCIDPIVKAIGGSSASCASLASRGKIEAPTWVGGLTCQKVFDDAAFLASLGADGPVVKAVCNYGQLVGSAIAKPSGHYEETNAASWDLVDDVWAAAVKLFKK